MKNFSLAIALLVAFVNYMGLALVFPLFSMMLFSENLPFLPADTSSLARGAWLGLLVAAMPLAQFVSSPLLGAFSDQVGRKKALNISLFFSFLGYVLSAISIFFAHLPLLLLSRIVIGSSAGNSAIVQSSLADISSSKTRSKNFGLYQMSVGLGFTLGPFLAGELVIGSNFLPPFLFSASACLFNWLLILFFFKETLIQKNRAQSFSLKMAIAGIYEVFSQKTIRNLSIALLIYSMGWAFFFEFMPVFLKETFSFSSKDLGDFYALSGGLYAFASALLIRPVLKHFSSKKILLSALILAGGILFSMLFIKTATNFYLLLPLLLFFVALIYPSLSSLISENSSSNKQGSSIGLMQSVQSFAFGAAPLFFGSLIGFDKRMPIFIGAGSFLFAAFLYIILSRKNK